MKLMEKRARGFIPDANGDDTGASFVASVHFADTIFARVPAVTRDPC